MKKIISLLAILFTVLIFASCNDNDTDSKINESTKADSSYNETSSSYKENETVSNTNNNHISDSDEKTEDEPLTEKEFKEIILKLPDQYELEYSFSLSKNGKAVSENNSKAIKTDEGIYFENGNQKSLFIKQDNGKYLTYNYDEESGVFKTMFSGTNTDMLENLVNKEELMIDEEKVMAYGSSITPYFNFYNSYANSMYLDSQKGIQNVNCDVYKIDNLNDSNGFIYEFYIDPATGICFGCSQKTVSGDETTLWLMECVKYNTENVSLPLYE